jgi:hypothetical protein
MNRVTEALNIDLICLLFMHKLKCISMSEKINLSDYDDSSLISMFNQHHRGTNNLKLN